MALVSSSSSFVSIPRKLAFFTTHKDKDKWNVNCRFVSPKTRTTLIARRSSCTTSYSAAPAKRIWIWTENKQVMTAAVERGWNTFVFSSESRQLPDDWSFYVEEGGIFDGEKRRTGSIFGISNPQELELIQHEKGLGEKVVVDLLDRQVIPAENIVAAFQEREKHAYVAENIVF